MPTNESSAIHGLVELVRHSLLEHAQWHFWEWAFAFATPLVMYLRAKRKGLSAETTNQWLGASLAIGIMIIMTGLLVWSVWAFVAVGAVSIAVLLANMIVGRHNAERERLGRHKKGLFDYRRELRRSQPSLIKAMNRIAARTSKLGIMAQSAGEAVEREKLKHPDPLPWVETIARRVARTYRSYANEVRRDAVSLKDHTVAYAAAIDGLAEWTQNSKNPDYAREDREVVVQLRDVARGAIRSQSVMRDTLLNHPNTSQESNAAVADVRASIQLTIDAFQILVDYCERAIRRLK